MTDDELVARARARGGGAATAAAATARLMPAIDPDPIDTEIFFSSLPVRSLLDYARLVKRLTSGDPTARQSLAADGVSLEMIAVINQTWSALFASRTDLAIRFSRLISATWTQAR
jgi:cellulose synthase operon protein C